MAYKINPFTSKLDKSNDIPQLATDPTSPSRQQSWVLAGGADIGSPIGLLLSLFLI